MGIILSALAGAGNAMAEVEGDKIKASLQQAKELALEKFREDSRIKSEERGIVNRAKERAMVMDETVANAPRLRDIKAGDIKSEELAKLDPEIQALKNKARTEALTADEQAKLDFYETNKGKILSRKSAESAAGRDPMQAKIHQLQLESAQIDLDYKRQETKLPPAVKARAESIRDEIKTISSAISKAQADGMFDANSENAGTLAKRYETLTGQLDKLLSPYYGGKAQEKEKESPPKGPWNKYTANGGADTKPVPAKSEPEAPPASKSEKSAGIIAAQVEPKQKSVLDNIEAERLSEIQPLVQQYKLAEQQFLTAARAGKQNEVGAYMREKEAIRAKLEEQVRASFGNQADRILKQIYTR